MSEATPVVALSSGGKDSLFMLETLRRDPAWRVEALVTTVNDANRRVAMHGTPEALLRAQAESLGIALTIVGLPENCDNQQYERRLADGMATFFEAGITTVACGDLFLSDIRRWREQSFRKMGWQTMFPIWHTPTDEMARRLIEEDWQAIVTCIDTQIMPESSLGRCIDGEFLRDLPPGVDPCGENGEFHTFVCDAPGFSRAVDVKPGRRVLAHDRYLMLDLEAG